VYVIETEHNRKEKNYVAVLSLPQGIPCLRGKPLLRLPGEREKERNLLRRFVHLIDSLRSRSRGNDGACCTLRFLDLIFGTPAASETNQTLVLSADGTMFVIAAEAEAARIRDISDTLSEVITVPSSPYTNHGR